MTFEEVTGDIFEYIKDKKIDAICCTTNMIVKSNGELVMGAGVAKAFAEKHPELPKRFGTLAKYWIPLKTSVPVSIMTYYKNPYIIYFPTKHHWKDPSPPELVERSLQQLKKIVTDWEMKKVVLPRPGCSNGGLSWDGYVKHLCEKYLDERFVIINYEII